jgi:hypothetical protein
MAAESNRVWALLRAILRWASGTGRIENNPSADIPRPFEEKPRKRVLSDVEIKNVWTGIEGGFGDEASKIAMKKTNSRVTCVGLATSIHRFPVQWTTIQSSAYGF